MATSELTLLIKTRGRVRARLTAFNNFLEKIRADSSKLAELPSRLEKVELVWQEFDVIQNKIEDIDESSRQEIEREAFNDAYHAAITAARVLMPQLDRVTTAPHAASLIDCSSFDQQLTLNNQSSKIVKLPNIDLPKFDGSYDKWMPFQELFTSLIDNNMSLPAVQKLHYLKTVLVGEAAKVVHSIELSNDNYTIAWNLLKSRYENKRLIVQHHLQGLLDMTPVVRESHTAIRQLVDNIAQHVQSLSKLGQPIQHWDTLLIHLLMSKLDKATRREWESKRAMKENFPTLTEFTEFLNTRRVFLESLAHSHVTGDSPHPSKGYTKTTVYACVSDKTTICPMCGGDHKVYECSIFRSWSPSDRAIKVKEKRLCVKCLKDYHGRICNAFNCKRCKGHHNTLLHINKVNSIHTKGEPVNSEEASNSAIASVDNQQNASVVSTLTHCVTKGLAQIILSTAIVRVRDKSGNIHECRALLDSGSQSNFITESLCSRLQLVKHPMRLTVLGINGTPIKGNQQVYADIQSRYSAFRRSLPFLTIERITENLPINKINLSDLKVPKNITLADPKFHMPGTVDILLGAEVFWELIGVGQIRFSRNLPIFQKTQLGWIVSGPLGTNKYRTATSSYCALSFNKNISQQLERFWQIEEIHSTQHQSLEERKCEEHFQTTHKRDKDGRFIVKLPLREDPPNIGESYNNAEQRLQSIERKLNKDHNLKAYYHTFMKEYLQLEHMTENTNVEFNSKSIYYLPHHAVIKEASTTTKVRVVFDASCRSSNGKSLNDMLLIGPTIQDELFNIILRLRQHKYAMTADVAKMYRQIRVDESQRDLQCILWRWIPTEPIRQFHLNTVTYGLSSSPFLAIRCLQETAILHQQQFPAAASTILRDFYVDDLITGRDNVKELQTLKEEIICVLNNAKFELRKWRSNASELCSSTSKEDSTMILGEEVKTLGLQWNTVTDRFLYNTQMIEKERATKRNILADIAQIYDPLGLLGPIIIQTKILLQRLWQLKLKWDEPVPASIHTIWIKWKQQILCINKFQIPRRVLCDEPSMIEMHAFCDASEAAYGACVYLRSSNTSKDYNVRLLCAKSRVAPLKKISLPRLELCSALLLAKLCNKVTQALTISIHGIFYWSDSTITLAWIAGEPYQWNTFVANRVSEIQQLTDKNRWYHVRSEDGWGGSKEKKLNV